MQNAKCKIGARGATGNLATALGYANTLKAIRNHVGSEDKGVNEMVTPGGTQQAIVINESGLYSLILSSKLEQARAFKRWVTNEVLAAQGYKNVSKALADHVEEDDKGTLPIRESAYETRAIVINESGLYSLILSSKLPQARAFKHWVTSEVLPQIRRTGGYISGGSLEGEYCSA